MLAQLLRSDKRDIKKEACWMLSNITAGSAAQIDAVCASGCMQHLRHLVEVEEFDVKKEAAYALCNACKGGMPAIVSGLVSIGILPTLVRLLDSPDADLLLCVVDALQAILVAAEASDPCRGVALVVEQLETAGGNVKLESLQEHENAAVYQKSNWLLETYFAETDEPTSVPTATADGYSFGAPAVIPALHFGP